MSVNPRKFRQPWRLIVSVEASEVERIDRLMNLHPAHRHRNRSEFVRRAIEQEMARCGFDDFHRP